MMPAKTPALKSHSGSLTLEMPEASAHSKILNVISSFLAFPSHFKWSPLRRNKGLLKSLSISVIDSSVEGVFLTVLNSVFCIRSPTFLPAAYIKAPSIGSANFRTVNCC